MNKPRFKTSFNYEAMDVLIEKLHERLETETAVALAGLSNEIKKIPVMSGMLQRITEKFRIFALIRLFLWFIFCHPLGNHYEDGQLMHDSEDGGLSLFPARMSADILL